MSSRGLLGMATAITVAGSLVLAAGPPAAAASGTYTQPAPITGSTTNSLATAAAQQPFAIPDLGSVSSKLTLAAATDDAVATYVTVAVTVDHGHLDDVDLVLEAPDGRAVTLASDIGGNSSGEHALSFYHLAAPFPDGSLEGSSATGAPVDYDTAGDLDAYPGNPPAALRPLGGTLLNGPGGGVWTLHASDDTSGNVGSVTSWSLGVFYGRPAAPSPSILAVSGLPSDITDVNLVLADISGSNLGAEFLLESPDGRYAHVLSDADGTWPQGLELTLDDEADTDVPQAGATPSAAYRPRNYDDSDQSEPIAGLDTMDMDARLSAFDDGPANGTWKLWVFQESCCATLTIGSWSLEITAADQPAPPSPPAPPSLPTPTTPSAAADTTAPVLSGVHLTPGRLPTGVGARLQVSSTEPARLAGVVERKRNGAWRRVGAKRWSVQTGANTRLFYGKTAEGRLRTGRYRVLLVATDAAGNASAEARQRFRVDRG